MTQENVMSKTELLTKMQDGWREFSAYLKTLTAAQQTVPTDAAGWTVKDHLMHIAVWEDGISALFEGKSRSETMHLDEATFQSGDFDKMNAVIQQYYKDKTLPEVMTALQDAHERLMSKVQTLSNDDLSLPYKHWQPTSTSETAIINYIISDSYDHYREHTPWIDAIVKSA